MLESSSPISKLPSVNSNIFIAFHFIDILYRLPQNYRVAGCRKRPTSSHWMERDNADNNGLRKSNSRSTSYRIPDNDNRAAHRAIS